jgi:hypothetical protein
MLNAEKSEKGNRLFFKLNGIVDDQANFDQVFGAIPPAPAEFHIHCNQITRINSVGVKAWIKFFQAVQAKHVKVVYYECSPPLVLQMNLVFNFLCGGRVESFQAGYSCESCENPFLAVLNSASLQKDGFKPPLLKCPKCNESAEFDDIPKVYFKFLTSPPAR